MLGPLVTGPLRLDGDAAYEIGVRALDELPAVFALLAAGSPDPADVWLARGTFQLAAVLAQLGARADWVALTGA